mmetsp:Transcript_2730/g.6622  ORF Transcript_2730/g.6622 Transcript_2730/m.6622 type:complete len:207 (-) Transcript_2730:606-1226(-)
MSWADEEDEPEELSAAALASIQAAQQVILEHLRAEENGTMRLSTIGNRIPKQHVAVLREAGVRISDVARSMPDVSVQGGYARFSGPIEQVVVHPVYCRGKFIKKLRRGDVEDKEIVEVAAVIRSVYDLVAAAECQELSTFALGNGLAPGCRAFLKGYSCRLWELLREFPTVFDCKSGSPDKPIVKLAPGCDHSEANIRCLLLARKA